MKFFNFFLLVFVFSIPVWVLTVYVPDISQFIPVKLPLSALMTFCPMLAAVVLCTDKAFLFSTAFDFKKIKDKKWYIVIIFFMPLIVLLSYWYTTLNGILPKEQNTPIIAILIYFIVFFIGAIGEEMGWSGYITEPLQKKIGALNASIIIGLVWASWHIIPFSQAHQSSEWIFWQFIITVFLRIVMVWIFNNTGKSVFGIVLFHTMINVSVFSLPNYGAYYSPYAATIFLFIAIELIVMLWDKKTLTRFYFSKNTKLKQE